MIHSGNCCVGSLGLRNGLSKRPVDADSAVGFKNSGKCLWDAETENLEKPRGKCGLDYEKGPGRQCKSGCLS